VLLYFLLEPSIGDRQLFGAAADLLFQPIGQFPQTQVDPYAGQDLLGMEGLVDIVDRPFLDRLYLVALILKNTDEDDGDGTSLLVRL
jgi:hypothetical protein